MKGFISVRILLVYLCVLWTGVTTVAAVTAGFDGFNCAGPLRDGKVVFACDLDCRVEHNAEYGFCGNATNNDFACYCTRPKKTVSEHSIQCVDRKDRKKYERICRTDCLCNHAALDSRCNYRTHACECIGQASDMSLCPFQTKTEMIDFVIAQHGKNFPKRYDPVTETFILESRLD